MRIFDKRDPESRFQRCRRLRDIRLRAERHLRDNGFTAVGPGDDEPEPDIRQRDIAQRCKSRPVGSRVFRGW